MKRLGPQAPNSPRLLPASDSGFSDTDGLTRNDNRAGRPLSFEVDNVLVGATVTILADGVPIGSRVADSSLVVVTTDEQTVLAEGARAITATQTITGCRDVNRRPSFASLITSLACASRAR